MLRRRRREEGDEVVPSPYHTPDHVIGDPSKLGIQKVKLVVVTLVFPPTDTVIPHRWSSRAVRHGGVGGTQDEVSDHRHGGAPHGHTC
jgi:hypothetical protein